MEKGTEAQQLVWEGAIPLQIHLHESEVTTLPPPPPVMILAPRIGYLPLLVPQIQPLFRSALPPGTDTVWFDYKGLPLKWYIPTGVLFDLLCAEPERPWNLTVHFRGYPTNILTPCEDEVAVKWNFINSLKEAAYIINGNCKNIMNMSQSDQLELWCSVLNGNLEVFLRVSSKLKLGAIEDEFTEKLYLSLKKSKSSIGNAESPGLTKTGRIPVRLYIRIVAEEVDDLEDAPEINSWEQISYINRPVDFHKVETSWAFRKESVFFTFQCKSELNVILDIADRCFSLGDMVRSLMPEYSGDKPPNFEEGTEQDVQDMVTPEDASGTDVAEEASTVACKQAASCHLGENDRIKLIRIQGIEPKKEIPFSWVVNNLGNPDFFLHVCVYIKS